jgi:hypothetical protein
MTEDDRRPRLHQIPAPRVADADLRPLLVWGVVLWVLASSAALALGDDPVTAQIVVREVTKGLAGAAFGVLVAGLVFDRLKRQAERAAARRRDLEQEVLTAARRELWIQEHSLPYEGLVDEVTTDLCTLVRALLRVFRVEPVRRALQRRGVDPAFVVLGTTDLQDLELRLSFSETPTPSGGQVLAEIAAEVRASAAQLRDVVPHRDADVRSLDTDLLAELAASAAEVTPTVEGAVDRIWSTLMDLRSLHAELLDERLPEPELSIGTALTHGLRIRHALSGWRGRLDATGSGNSWTVLQAQILTSRASDMTTAAAQLYAHVVGLHRHMQETYLAGLGFPAGEEFIRGAAEEQDRLVRWMGEVTGRANAGTSAGLYAAAVESARTRTFLRPEDAERVSDLFELAGPAEQGEGTVGDQ